MVVTPGLFVWLSLGAAVWCLAIYGAWALFVTRPCDLPIGALL